MILLELFYEFFKIGLFSVGGGLSVLPFLYDISARTGWFDQKTIADMIAVSESTPGPIGVNMATYTGFTTAGVVGGIVATLGIILPALIIVISISRFFGRFDRNPAVAKVFTGLRPAAAALIMAAALRVMWIALVHEGGIGLGLSLINWPAVALFVALLLLMRRFKAHPVVFIAISAVAGIVIGL